MARLLSVGDLADSIFRATGEIVTPTALSQHIYRQRIPPELIATVAGRKVIAERDLDAVIDALAERGIVRREAGVA